MSKLNYAYCPCKYHPRSLKREAKGKAEVERLFGIRNMGDGRILVQAWCRYCRRKYSH